jgi:hypothetical protein
MKKYFLLFAVVMVALATACEKKDISIQEGEDYIVIKGIKWALKPVTSYLGDVEGAVPPGFSSPTLDQLKKLPQVSAMYYGHLSDGTKGVLFGNTFIGDYSYSSVGDDGTVRNADYNRYTFTDDDLKHGVFLPVNDGWDGYYWGKYDQGYYTYLHFSMIEMKTYMVPNMDAGRVLTILGGLLPVKN